MKTSQKIYLPFKRIIAILGSLTGIIVCFALLWWWVFTINLIVTKGHPMFARHRIGRNGKAFRCIKFRSMKVTADPHMSSTGGAVTEEQITGFGKFLRKSSIDETPQLLNIFIGQMAFIGPRPLIDVNEEDRVTVEKRKENGSIILRPGLSGYAQMHRRGGLDPIKKAEYDYYYLKHFSLWFDIKIFVKTLFRIFDGEAK